MRVDGHGPGGTSEAGARHHAASYLCDLALAAAHLEQTHDIGATVRGLLDAAGLDARVCVLPEGPQTIPYVSHDTLAEI